MNLFKRAGSIFKERGPVDLGNGNVMTAIIRLALPTIATMLFHTTFNLVDTIFISWLGEGHMVAISYTFPVLIGVFAVIEGTGSGITALVGRRLGEGSEKEAQRTATSGLAFAYLLCLVWIPFLFPSVSDAFFRSLGATDPEILHQAWLYNMWVPPTVVLINFSYVTNSIFRCQGNTIVPLKFFLISNGLNFVLDPIFIFTFGWGMTGAAAATFVGRLVGMLYLIKTLRTSSKIKLDVITLPQRNMVKTWFEITAIGLPVALTTASVAFGMGGINKMLTNTYGNVAVAGWMMGLRIEDLAFNTVMGVSQSLVPFLAFNYGMRNYQRMREGIISAFKLSFAITLTMGLLICIFPHPFTALFNPSEAIANAAVRVIRISISGYPFVLLNVVFNSLFIATGHTLYGLVVQISRNMLRVPAAWFLAGFVSINWIWLFQPLTFAASSIFTVIFAFMLMRRLRRELGER